MTRKKDAGPITRTGIRISAHEATDTANDISEVRQGPPCALGRMGVPSIVIADHHHRALPSVCAICGEATTTGQSAHGICGGHLSADPREYVLMAACHIGKLLRTPRTADYLCEHLRPEYQGEVLEEAVAILVDAGEAEWRWAGEQLKLTRKPAPRARKPRDDGTADGLFEVPRERLTCGVLR
jgi:hypothetical protein